MKKYIWSNVNDKKDCVEYLKLLNDTINNLFELDNFVLRNIFNPSTNVREDDIPDFCDIACVLERYRNILVGGFFTLE